MTTTTPTAEPSFFAIEGFLRMRTDYQVTLALDALILKPNVTQEEILSFVQSTIKGLGNERKI